MKGIVKTGRQGFRFARLGWVAAVSLSLASGVTLSAQTNDNQSPPPSVMPWVSDVVKMNDAGITPDVIVNYVRNTDARSTLNADSIIYLRDHGISSSLITTMIQHGAVPPSAPAAQPVPMPATSAPIPSYAQYGAAPAQDYSDSQPQPAVNYNYYGSTGYGYNTPYWYYSYPYYPIYYYPYGFYYHNRFCFRPGFNGHSSFSHVGFAGGFHSSTVHSSFSSAHFGGSMSHGFSSVHSGGGMMGGMGGHR